MIAVAEAAKRRPGRPPGTTRKVGGRRLAMMLSADVLELVEAHQVAAAFPTRTAALEDLVRRGAQAAAPVAGEKRVDH